MLARLDGPYLITKVFMGGRQESWSKRERDGKIEVRNREKFEDPKLLALNAEDGPSS